MGWGGSRTDPKGGQKCGPTEEDAEGPQARYSTRRAQGPLLVTTPLGFRMRRYEQSFNARRLMMSFRVLPALHNLHFTKQMIVFSLIVVLQTTPAFLKVKGF